MATYTFPNASPTTAAVRLVEVSDPPAHAVVWAAVPGRADRWVTRRLHRAVTAAVAAIVVAGALSAVATSTSHWRSELFRSGTHTTGIVRELAVIPGGPKYADARIVTIDAVATPLLTVTVRVDRGFEKYHAGQHLDIWYDPNRTDHARTLWDTTGNDEVTSASALGAALLAALALQLLMTAGHASVMARLLRRGLRPATLAGTAKRHHLAGDHRVLFRFADADTAVWTANRHTTGLGDGGVHAAGTSRWQVVMWTDAPRPSLARRLPTSHGASLWTHHQRASSDTSMRPRHDRHPTTDRAGGLVHHRVPIWWRIYLRLWVR